MWKNNSPVMIGLYWPKANKNVLLVLTAHVKPNICDAPRKKPMVIEFYNRQRCVVDIMNRILRNYMS